MVKNKYTADVIVIGAGAAGLMAASVLSQKKPGIMILEAGKRIGGRIYTVKENNFKQPLELGAEFIHGNLPITIQLLKDAGINYYKVKGNLVSFRGKPHREKDFVEEPGIMERKLREVERDMPVKEFLKKHLAGRQYAEVRNSVKGFVEGYDTADTERASTLAFRDEWMESDDEQYRIEGGYITLVDFLAERCKLFDASIHTSAVVKQIKWKKNKVEIQTSDGNIYTAEKALVTVSLGVLTARENAKASIQFIPPVPAYSRAASALGFGSVIKVHLQFNHPFWEDNVIKQRTQMETDGLGFIFSDQLVPTWWTQYPVENNLLTGWMGGPPAEKIKLAGDKAILNKAILSLSEIFKIKEKKLLSIITASKLTNWTADPFTLGSYNYSVSGDYKSRKLLNTPIEDTIWFAGEALYQGPLAGTVEAALISGFAAADNMLK